MVAEEAGRADRTPEIDEAVDHAVVWFPSTVTSYSVAVRTTTVSPLATDWSEAGATRSWAPTLTPAVLRASPAVVKKPDTSWVTPSTSTVTWR